MPAKRKSDEKPAQSGSKKVSKISKKKTPAAGPNQRSLRSFFTKAQDTTAATNNEIEKSSHLPRASPQPLSQSSPLGAQVVLNETAQSASHVDGSPAAQADSISFDQSSSLVIRPRTVAHPAGFEFHAASLKDDGTAVEKTNPWEDHALGEEIASTSGQTTGRDGKEERLSFGSNNTEGDEEAELPVDDATRALEIDEPEDDPDYNEDYERFDEEDIAEEAPLSDEDLPFVPISTQNLQGDSLSSTDNFRRLLHSMPKSSSIQK